MFLSYWESWVAGERSHENTVNVARATLDVHRAKSVQNLWDQFNPEVLLQSFFGHLVSCSVDETVPFGGRAVVLELICLFFQSIEIKTIRRLLIEVSNISIWVNLCTDQRREILFSISSHLRTYWNMQLKKHADCDPSDLPLLQLKQRWISILIRHLYGTFSFSPDQEASVYLHWLLNLFIILELQLPTRRFVHELLKDHQITAFLREKQRERDRIDREGGTTVKDPLRDMLDLFQAAYTFGIDEFSGEMLEEDSEMRSEERILNFQKSVFTELKDEFTELLIATTGQIQCTEFMRRILSDLEPQAMHKLCEMLCARTINLDGSPMTNTELQDVIIGELCLLESPMPKLKLIPLYPLECSQTLIDRVLPPLTIQYLSISDYLIRHCAFYRRESKYSIDQHVGHCVTRIKPAYNYDRLCTEFHGRSKYAIPLTTCTFRHVGQMAAFDSSPSRVELEIRYDTCNVQRQFVDEWDGLKPGEVVFLASIKTFSDENKDYEIVSVRGAAVETLTGWDGMPIVKDRDETQESFEEFNNRTKRIMTVTVDRHQFAMDKRNQSNVEEIYQRMNVLIRRERRENNFWATIQAIIDLSGNEDLLPEWLREVYLGYGNPLKAHYSEMDQEKVVYFHDTFIDRDHLEASFEEKIKLKGQETSYLSLKFNNGSIHAKRTVSDDVDPFLPTVEPENKVRFTSVQVEAIKSGTLPGLTLIVGPPGTGKTDVAAQILSNLYHGKPGERILLLTHSNQALDQLFSKLLNMKHIPERHLLRLGHLDTEMAQYNRIGRVSHFLERRTELLIKVEVLVRTLNIPGDHAFSCETAYSFFNLYVESIWDNYWSKCSENAQEIKLKFPFAKYFDHYYPSVVLFGEQQRLRTYQDSALKAWNHIRVLFQDVQESQAFEVLRSDREKANYLIAKEARIIAMTTTYAALRRADLIELNFQYDTFMMEEAGTVLEIDTFIPLALSKKLKRLVLIGDHHQLPPVIQSPDLQGLAESLFVRLIRLGAHQIVLDKQGRTRKSICELYRHVYNQLGHLDHVDNLRLFNPGFMLDYQFINVPDYQNAGEHQPAPHYYQNLGEAEYVVYVYLFLSMIGYPPESVVILTTYNGQRELIREIMALRTNKPCHVTTVDKFQGRQSDIVLLSLVRTKSAGHLVDVRRLVVAMSRARLGLYVFGRMSVFGSVPTLSKTFDQFKLRPVNLQLVLNEQYNTETRTSTQYVEIESVEHMAQIVKEFEK